MVQNSLTPSRSPPKGQMQQVPEETRSKPGQLYGLPLSAVIRGQTLPEPLQAMLVRLYRDGPFTTGLFRKSANARIMRQVRERLDSGLPVDFEDVPILAVGAIFKEFLRSMPDCLIPLSHYGDCVATNTMDDEQQRVATVRTLLQTLPAEHDFLLRCIVPVLQQVCNNSEDNSMNARNVGICVGQSMMWPAQPEDVLKNDVPPFVEFMIDHAAELFGDLSNPMFEKIEAARQASDDGWDSEDQVDTPPSSPQRGADASQPGMMRHRSMPHSVGSPLRQSPENLQSSPPLLRSASDIRHQPFARVNARLEEWEDEDGEAPIAPPRRVKRRSGSTPSSSPASAQAEAMAARAAVSSSGAACAATPAAEAGSASAESSSEVEQVDDLGLTTIV